MSTEVGPDHADERALVRRLGDLRQRAQAPSDARRFVTELLDAETLTEVGTFASFGRPITALDEPWARGPVGGHGCIEGRPVTVLADGEPEVDPRGAKAARLYEMADRRGNPFVHVLRGTREPDLTEKMEKTGARTARGFGAGPTFPSLLTRNRSVPVVAVVAGDAFGSTAFAAGACDVLVQVKGSRLSAAAPSEQPFQPDASGLIDVTVSSYDEACEAVRKLLGYLPSHAGGALPATDVPVGPDDEQLGNLVPARRARAYDMKAVIRRVCDPQSFFELKPTFARNLITGFGRIAGQPVGIVASAPIHSAGALTPDSCIKGTAFATLCDSFGIPLVLLQDTPGFFVSGAAERDRAVVRSQTLLQALSLATVPVVSVVIRKAFGLAFVIMAANKGDLLLAWPGAEIGFMDPPVAANVLFEPVTRDMGPEERTTFLTARLAELAVNFEPYGVATQMAIDEVIEPGSTRRRIAEHLLATAARKTEPRTRALASWPRWH